MTELKAKLGLFVHVITDSFLLDLQAVTQCLTGQRPVPSSAASPLTHEHKCLTTTVSRISGVKLYLSLQCIDCLQPQCKHLNWVSSGPNSELASQLFKCKLGTKYSPTCGSDRKNMVCFSHAKYCIYQEQACSFQRGSGREIRSCRVLNVTN